MAQQGPGDPSPGATLGDAIWLKSPRKVSYEVLLSGASIGSVTGRYRPLWWLRRRSARVSWSYYPGRVTSLLSPHPTVSTRSAAVAELVRRWAAT